MRLTTYTDYALRVLIYVGLKSELATIPEISETYGISRNHLVKVVHELGSCGYLKTFRGKNGGLRLAKPAEEINVGELVRELEDDMRLVECFAPTPAGNCRIKSSCVLHRVLRNALEAFLQELGHHTLADLLVPNRSLMRLLALPPSAPPKETARS